LNEAKLENVSIVVVEYNPIFGPDRQVTVPRDDEFDRSKKHFSYLYYGASLKAFDVLLTKKGFCFVGTNRVGNNAFFVREEVASKIPFTARNDLSVYTDWRIREARDKEGRLSFVTGKDRLKLIGDLFLVDLESGSSIKVVETQNK
jgi:hypothetical protein